DVAVRAHLRAASDQRVRIDHGSISDPGARVDVHRGHAGDAAADIGAFADRRSARHDSYAVRRAEFLNWVGGFVQPRLTRGFDRHVDDRAHAEAEQNAFLDPGIHAPSGFCGGVGFRGADLAGAQTSAEIEEEAEIVFAVGRGFGVEEALDLSLHARSGRPEARAYPVPFRFWRDSPRREEPWVAGRRVRAGPS